VEPREEEVKYEKAPEPEMDKPFNFSVAKLQGEPSEPIPGNVFIHTLLASSSGILCLFIRFYILKRSSHLEAWLRP